MNGIRSNTLVFDDAQERGGTILVFFESDHEKRELCDGETEFVELTVMTRMSGMSTRV